MTRPANSSLRPEVAQAKGSRLLDSKIVPQQPGWPLTSHQRPRRRKTASPSTAPGARLRVTERPQREEHDDLGGVCTSRLGQFGAGRTNWGLRFRDLGAQGDLRELERVRCCSGRLASGPTSVADATQMMDAGFAVHWAAQR
jgi:hypothetical protein